MRRFLFLLAAALCLLSAHDNRPYNFSKALSEREAFWVDSVFNQLSLDERLGQLFILRAHSDKDAAYEQAVAEQVARFKPGGLCFFQGTPERQAELTNRYQSLSDRLPLLISMDAEWGLGMRLEESTIAFPKQLMLGALQENKLIYDMGREVARQCKRLGVHINFAPDADVNNNAANPVINDRSFGEDRYKVAAKCFQYMLGLQDGGVLACAKHFPGHGDTNVDSHSDLPEIPYASERLDSLELFPFRVLAQFGIASVMVGHLHVPTLDNRVGRPSSLSERTIYRLLRKSMGFEGLIFTDGMEMKAVSRKFTRGEAEMEALRAGNDVVTLPADIGAAIEASKRALVDKTLDSARIEASVKRVLRAKFRLGLTKPQRVAVENIRRELNTPQALLLKRRLAQDALTLVRDRDGLVPFRDLGKRKMATLALGDLQRTVFQTYCGYFAPLTHFNAGKEWTPAFEDSLLRELRQYEIVLVSLQKMRSRAVDNFGLTEQQKKFLRRLHDVTTVCLTVFGNPYALRDFDYLPTVLCAFNGDENTQDLAAQALFGANDLKGKLPVTVSPAARAGDGLQIVNSTHRLGYDLPESVGMSSDTLGQLDVLARELIASGAAPGAQLLVAKDGKVVWHKAFGHHTYEQMTPVTTESIFDMASVTKIAATTISLMKLASEGKFDPKAPLQNYVPDLKGTNKANFRSDEVLIHQAGLQAWIAFYKNTVDKANFPLPKYYQPKPDEVFSVPVAKDLYMKKSYRDSIWQQILTSDLRPDKKYVYSDLTMYLLAQALQNTSGQPLDVFAREQFYKPLGLATTGFNPWQTGLTARCVPTEEDRYFRQQRIQGYVHDMGAAMYGGVSGHAGLFSSANDLAKIFQMLLDKGQYFGQNYLSPAVVQTWTTRDPRSTRRGLGFDMKESDPAKSLNMSPFAGPGTFGHTGFTGICVWADPEKNLLFIFCSNRTYPTMENNKLISGDYRPRMHTIVYKALR